VSALRPGQWEVHKLGAYADFRNGVNFSAKDIGPGLPIINVGDFGSRSVPDYQHLTEIDPRVVKSESAILQDGDIVLVRSNGNRELVGRTMLIRSPPRVTHSAFTIRLRIHESGRRRLLPQYLAYLLRGPTLRATLSAQGHGTNISNLNQGVLDKLALSLPSLSIQCKITATLSAYDDLIENNSRRIKLLEEVAQRIYREWFVDFRYPGHEDVPLVDSEWGRIPKGWDVSPVGSLTQVVGGGTPSKGVAEYWEPATIAWFTPTDLTRSSSMFMLDSAVQISEDGLAKSSARLFPPGAVMMTSRATIGVVSITTIPATTNQGFITCLPSEHLGTYRLYFWLVGHRNVITALASGATFKEINKKTFRGIPFVNGPREIEQEFEAHMKPIGLEILALLRMQQTLRETRDLLLPRLVSGEIDVTDFDIAVQEFAA
jgi:type I restriction enzyme S subunit